MQNHPEIFKRLIFLDLLRLIALISVLGVHQYQNYLDALTRSFNDSHGHLFSYVINSFFHYGLAGVCVFFFVSGFAITIASRRESSKVFVIRRFCRIFPLYLIASILELVLGSRNFQDKKLLSVMKDLLLNLTMLGDYTNTPPNISGIAWTLRIEILFYLIIWLNIFLKEKFLKNFSYFLFLAAMITYGFIIKIPTGINMGNRYYVGIFLPILIIGSLCASVYQKEQKTLSIVLIIIFCSTHLYLTLKYKPDFFSNGNYLLAVLLIIFFAIQINFKVGGPLIVKLARFTYSFYLFHTFLLTAFQRWINKLIYNEEIEVKFISLILANLFTFLFSIVTYYLIEKPINKRVRKY